ncbi:hypothetical protein DFR31_0516 [Alkalispirillum mobile]|uniref:Uncharacterized protein n=1 Tax=Alkalispirillum mobile TaxID=85925 RepID=A0A498CBR5_9GAMM|nr:hypothetical protein [Alkalispirillum mobile]RLK50610.1 hypothetical protein DFR31_0516 [Alkalispirillum mobile]
MDNTHLERRLADPYAFALLQWPATLGLLALSHQGWWLALNILLGLWLALMLLAAYAGDRPGRIAFGNAMLLSNLTVAGAYWAHPGPWVLAWLAATLLLLYVAQRALFRAPESAHEASQTAGEVGE